MEYCFGTEKLIISKGYKSNNDYILNYLGNQFTDKEHFEKILENFNNINLFKSFINIIKNNIFLFFDNTKIASPCLGLTNTSKIDALYNFIKNLNFSDIQKMLIFISILRIDIDNICYSSSTANGGKRHFIQLIILGIVYFQVDSLAKKVGITIPTFTDLNIQTVSVHVYSIGMSEPTSNFNNYYINYIK